MYLKVLKTGDHRYSQEQAKRREERRAARGIQEQPAAVGSREAQPGSARSSQKRNPEDGGPGTSKRPLGGGRLQKCLVDKKFSLKNKQIETGGQMLKFHGQEGRAAGSSQPSIFTTKKAQILLGRLFFVAQGPGKYRK